MFLDSERFSALGERKSPRHLEAQVRKPVLREKLEPHFQFGCNSSYLTPDSKDPSPYPGFATGYVICACHFNPPDYRFQSYQGEAATFRRCSLPLADPA